MCFHFLKCNMEKQMRLKVMTHSFFFFPRRNHYIMRVINSFRNKDTCLDGCKKERSKVTTALVRFYFYYYVEQFLFFASFYVVSEYFYCCFLSFSHSQFLIYLFHPSRNFGWQKQWHNCMPRSKSEEHTES